MIRVLCERCGFVAHSLPTHCQCPDCCYPLTVTRPDFLTVAFVLIGGGAGALAIVALHWLGVLQ